MFNKKEKDIIIKSLETRKHNTQYLEGIYARALEDRSKDYFDNTKEELTTRIAECQQEVNELDVLIKKVQEFKEGT